MTPQKILCMGSINMDLVMYMDHLPEKGETILTDNFQTFPGGKGGNQSVAASLLGGKVSCFTKLSSDTFSKQLIKEQINSGVDTQNILIEPESTAGIAMIRVEESGQNSISFTSGANGLLTPKDVLDNQHIFQHHDILLITMEIREDTVYQAIKLAKEKNLLVILDPAPAPVGGIPDEIAQLVDYVKPNETETKILTGITITDEKTALEALKFLKNQGFKKPIITLGTHGSVTYVNSEVYWLKSHKVASVDTTAAGDIFLGAFTAYLSQHKPYVDCLEFANTAAALSTTVKGAQSSIPSIEQIILALK